MPESQFESFCNTTQAPAFKYLVSGSKLQKSFWTICLLSGMVTIVILVGNIRQEWAVEPWHVTSDAVTIKITEVDFPAVAICDINRISRSRALELASRLRSYTNQSLEFLLDLIKLLGNLYDFTSTGALKFQMAEEIFTALDNGTTDWQKLVMRMASLAVPCEELLQDCSWDAASYNCTQLFQTRLTESGICCVFNYVRLTKEGVLLGSDDRVNAPLKFPETGQNKGLSVTINTNTSDYFYTSIASRGSLIKLFLSEDFPDFASGSMKQIILQEGSEAFVDITANELKTDDGVRWFSQEIALKVTPIMDNDVTNKVPIENSCSKSEQRNCMYRDEDESASGTYSSSNCFVDCKTDSLATLCGCVPFLLPSDDPTHHEVDETRVCNFRDLSCLSKYQAKLTRYFPVKNQDEEALKLDLIDCLDCYLCLPNCEEVSYEINTRYSHFENQDALYPNASRLHIFSTSPYANLYKKMVMVTWSQALSTFGGIASLILGLTVINIVELLVVVIKVVISKLAHYIHS